MKTNRSLLFVITGFCLLIACSKSDHFWGDIPFGNTMKDRKTDLVMVTTPFEVDYVGNYTSVEVVAGCGDYPNMRIVVDGTGTGTHVGKSTIHFDFCCQVETGVYGFGVPTDYIVAANGDILFISCAGQVKEGRLPDHPDFVISYWRDPFVILGGTGRFKGATGGGMTDDYNSSRDPYSHHHWKGTITMVKGKN
jgi:hypothetical protein